VSAYVGLTYNSEKRKQEHITGIGHRKVEQITPVTKFLREHPTYEHKYKELTDYIEPNEAVKMEKYWELKYFKDGWKVLNIAPTGSLGTTRKQTYKQLKNEVDYVYNVKGVKFLKDLMRDYPNLYMRIFNRGLHVPENEGYLLGKFEKTRNKKDDELMDEVKKYKSYSEFFKDQSLYLSIKYRKLLPKVKDYFDIPYTDEHFINKALKYDTYRDVQKNTVYSVLRNRGLLPKIKELFAQKEQENQSVESN
jgi:hypothetical protein